MLSFGGESDSGEDGRHGERGSHMLSENVGNLYYYFEIYCAIYTVLDQNKYEF